MLGIKRIIFCCRLSRVWRGDIAHFLVRAFQRDPHHQWKLLFLLDMKFNHTKHQTLNTNSDKETRQALALAAEHSRLADLYHAFHHVHSFTTDPFTDLQPEVLLQVCIMKHFDNEDFCSGISVFLDVPCPTGIKEICRLSDGRGTH